jgi:SAM-dependent methyltransferase
MAGGSDALGVLLLHGLRSCQPDDRGRAVSGAEIDTTKAAAKAVWGASPAGTTYGGGAEPGSRAFFEAVLAKRRTQEMTWLNEVFPFSSSRGLRVLEVGCGAGYDAYEFCRNGAIYTGVEIAPENVIRTRTHLGIFGYEPKVVEGDAESLPFPDESFDIVFSNGVLHHTPDLDAALREIHRVLMPGGRFWMTVYHRDSVFYWLSLGLFDHVLRGGFRTRTFKERVAMIEFTTSASLPLVNVYSRRQVRRALQRAGLHVDRIAVRKLLREDLPDVGPLNRFTQRTPQSVLDGIGRWFGWYVVALSRKP